MKRQTDKQLFDAIESRLFNSRGDPLVVESVLIAYAQLRALERIADTLHVLVETLAMIRADISHE